MVSAEMIATHIATPLPKEWGSAFVTKWQQYYDRLAYNHRVAEWSLYLLFFSGLLLWDFFSVQWSVFRWSLFMHTVMGVLVFPVTLGLFWVSHRRLLRHSEKKLLKTTGIMIDVALLVCTLTGFFLFFIGDNGSVTGSVVSYLHLIVGLLLGPLVLRHALRWTVLKVWVR